MICFSDFWRDSIASAVGAMLISTAWQNFMLVEQCHFPLPHLDFDGHIPYDAMMPVPQIVIDTNVLVAAFRSRNGASFRLLSTIDSGKFEINLSVPLVLEYEDVLRRLGLGFSPEDVADVIDYLCAVGNKIQVYFLWRPFLNDPNDEMVLELAVAARCDYIVTFNQRDFLGAETFGLQVVRPSQFLRFIGDVL